MQNDNNNNVVRRLCPQPGCGKIVVVRNYKPEFENMDVKCPKCQRSSKLSNWSYVEKKDSGKSENNGGGTIPNVPGQNGSGTIPNMPGANGSGGGTLVNLNPISPVPSANPGYLEVAATRQKFPLSIGEQVVGKWTASSQANIKIGDSNNSDEYMSRKHVAIEVQRAGNGFRVVMKDLRPTNDTILNGTKVNKGDICILNPGDVLTLGFTDVKYVVDDPDATVVKTCR